MSIALFVCGLLLWKPVQAEAATQVDNLVLMVNFSEDGANTFQTNFSRYQEMYTGPESEPNRSLSQYISTISDGQVTVNTYFPQVVNNVFLPVTIQGSASDYPDASAGEQFVQQVITAAQNMSELSFPSKLDSMRGDGYIDNLTIIVQVDENNTSGAFGSRKQTGDITRHCCMAGMWVLIMFFRPICFAWDLILIRDMPWLRTNFCIRWEHRICIVLRERMDTR